jgi:hypothetical protein
MKKRKYALIKLRNDIKVFQHFQYYAKKKIGHTTVIISREETNSFQHFQYCGKEKIQHSKIKK